MNVFGTVFDPKPVKDAVERRKLELDGGISCIVDWHIEKDEPSERSEEIDKKKPDYIHRKRLKDIADEVGELFGPCFRVHPHLHSTVLSIELDEEDLNEIKGSYGTRVRARTWCDPKYVDSQWIFRELLKRNPQGSLTFTLDSAFIARAGTVQLVLRNEDQLPAMRGFMVSRGAQVKPGTIDGDFVYTCTVVLGQAEDAEEAEKRLPKVRENLSKLAEGERFSTNVLTIMEYWDFGLVKCKPLAYLTYP